MPDTYLLDTSMLGKFYDDRPDWCVDDPTRRFRAHLERVRDARFVICAVTIGEVEYGLESAPPDFPEEKRQHIRSAVRNFEIVYDISSHTASPYYAQARAKLFQKFALKPVRGRRAKARHVEDLLETDGAKPLGIQENDLWIASVAMEYNMVLVTGDKLSRITEVCPELRVENWLL